MEPTIEQYITDLTNGCLFLDTLVSENGDISRVQEIVDGIEYQLTLVAESDKDLTLFQNSVNAAKTYIQEADNGSE